MLTESTESECLGIVKRCFAVLIRFWFKDVISLKSPITTMHSHVGPVLLSLGSHCRLVEQVTNNKDC